MTVAPLLAALVMLALAGPSHAKEMTGKTADAKHMLTAPSAAPADGMQGKLAELRRLAAANDEEGVHALVASLVDEPDFDTLEENLRYAAWSASGSLAWQRGDTAAALAHFTRATQFSLSRPEDWQSRAWLALIEGALEDSAASLAELARRWPRSTPDLDPQLLYGALEAGFESPARYDLLQALYAADYAPRHLGDASGIWLALAEQQVARAKPEAAKATLARVRTAPELIRVLADRRYDTLIDRDAPQFDLRRAALERVADLRARAILDPRRLEIQVELASAMLVAGQDDDVVALVEEIAAAVDASEDDDPPYDDLEDQLPWAYNAAATALVRLGHADRAVGFLQRGAALAENGVPNISQTLNLGQLYNSLGHHDDALATVAKVVDHMSTIGRMVQANARLRAAQSTGRADAAAEAMAVLREGRDISAEIYLDSLVEAGELDEAARLLLDMLDSPAERADALYSVQDYPDHPELPGEARHATNWRRLVAREDVQTAVKRVGRILPELPVYGR